MNTGTAAVHSQPVSLILEACLHTILAAALSQYLLSFFHSTLPRLCSQQVGSMSSHSHQKNMGKEAFHGQHVLKEILLVPVD